MTISIIVAASRNNVIGKNNALIWQLPADMKYFKDKTIGHCVLSGRKNFDSIPKKYRPLSDRTNIVVTRNHALKSEGVFFVENIEEGIQLAREKAETELFVIGGGQIYEQSMRFVDKIYLTRIDHDFEGDTFFPVLDENLWKEVKSEFRLADDRNRYNMTFHEYVKK